MQACCVADSSGEPAILETPARWIKCRPIAGLTARMDEFSIPPVTFVLARSHSQRRGKLTGKLVFLKLRMRFLLKGIQSPTCRLYSLTVAIFLPGSGTCGFSTSALAHSMFSRTSRPRQQPLKDYSKRMGSLKQNNHPYMMVSLEYAGSRILFPRPWSCLLLIGAH